MPLHRHVTQLQLLCMHFITHYICYACVSLHITSAAAAATATAAASACQYVRMQIFLTIIVILFSTDTLDDARKLLN